MTDNREPMGFVVYADELDGRASFQWSWRTLLDALTWHLPNVRQYHGPLVGTLQAEPTFYPRTVCFVRFTPGSVTDNRPAHPEDSCGRCGRPNVSWSVDSDRFNMAVYRGEIVCPVCFVKAHEEATGMTCSWELVPASPFRWIEDEGRETPFLAGRVQ